MPAVIKIKLTNREEEKLTVINDCLSGKITKAQAATMLGISTRQIKRLKNKVREQGAEGVIHHLKGKQGNHHIEQAIKDKALKVIKETYTDFKPTFATEKLEKNHDIHISHGTTRLWMIEEKLWKPRKQKKPTYRSLRPRKEHYGELQQFDGSYHYWFENRYLDANRDPIEVCLLAAIDDATGKITKAAFMANEGLIAVFTFWKEYLEERGKPVAIYLDKFCTYKINHKAAVDNKDLLTQFQRAMQQLDINLITANSAQAKGRIERLFGTLQDRLVKELRLARISNPSDGNGFLKESFIPAFNEKFAVLSAKEGDVHRSLLQREKDALQHIFSVHATRRINFDFTIQFKNNWYQLTEIQPTTVRPLMIVLVETWLDGSVHLILNNHELAYMALPEKPKKQRIKQPVILTTHTLNYKPPPNHPWRQYDKTNR
jgi:transposase